MKKSVTLAVQARDTTKKPKDLRKAGLVPCVVYGNKTKHATAQCNGKEFHAAYLSAGQNTLVDIELEGKKVPCLIHAVSFDPVSGAYEHIDLYAVDMTKKVTANVPVIVQGEAPAVKGLGGVLLTVHDELQVTCLPSDIPASFILDISVLENFHDSITVAAIKVPAGVVIENNPETVLVTVHEPRKEEEIVPVVAVPAEGDVAADGAVPAEGAEGAKPEEAKKKEESKK